MARHAIFRDRPDLAFPAIEEFICDIKTALPAFKTSRRRRAPAPGLCDG
jgi:hypothetical protein